MNEEEKKLNKLRKRTNRTLFILSSVWPFEFFPTTLRIDENKIDIIYHPFFFNHFVFSILIENINSVKVTTGPFFATISVEITGFEKNPDDLYHLPKMGAQKAKRIILGLIAARRAHIDLSKIEVEKMVNQLEEIGAAKME